MTALACGSPQEAAPAAGSEPPAATSAPQSRPAAATRWARLQEVSSWPGATAEPFASRGHAAGHYTMDVRVSEASRELYAALRPGTVLPDGTLIAALHHDPERGRRGPIYVMEKIDGRWEFSIVDVEGRISGRGAVELCRRCHAEAVSDHVFGLPSRLRPQPDGGS